MRKIRPPYRDKVFNNPRADKQDASWDDKIEKEEKDKTLYDAKQSVLDKIRAVIRKKKVEKLKGNSDLWKGLS